MFEAPISSKTVEQKLLRYGAGNTGEHVVGISAYETHRADYQYQDDGEHHGVFSNVLSFFVLANIAKILNHKSSGGKWRS
jgi:hypothetical protein